MALFRSHRESARVTNRVIVRFYAAMAILTTAFAGIVAGRYLLGWW